MNIESQPLIGTDVKRKVKLPQDFTSSPIRPEEILRADEVLGPRDPVAKGSGDACFVLRGTDEHGVKPANKSVERRVPQEDRFQQGLRKIDGVARACGFVVSLLFRLIPLLPC